MEHAPVRDFAANVKNWRDELGLSQTALAAAMEATGVKTTRDSIAKIEAAKRTDIGVSEVLAAAHALNVGPVDLLLPTEPLTETQLLPGLEPEPEHSARDWLTGDSHLTQTVRQTISAIENGTRPAQTVDHFYRHAPWRLQLREVTKYAAPLRAIRDLEDLLTTAVLRAHSGKEPKRDVEDLREALATVAAHVELACAELERRK